MRIGIALAAAIAILLAACAGEEEEGAAPDSIADMSAADILNRVVEAASYLNSIQEERSSTSISHELPPLPDLPAGALEGTIDLPQESTTRTLRIHVGEDSYARYRPEPPAGFCDEQPAACKDVPGFMDEELRYRGKSYFRNPETGEWVKWPDPGECFNTGSGSACSGAAIYLETTHVPFEPGDCPAAEHWFGYGMVPGATEQAAYTYYAFDFASIRESERLDDEVLDGVSLVHIRGALGFDFPDPYNPPDELAAIFEECGIELPTPDPESDRFSEWMPNRNEGEFEMWIDKDFHIRRLTFEGRSYNGDRLMQTDREEATYSLFNQAQLPGPLPD